jgi:hypothetical protein
VPNYCDNYLIVTGEPKEMKAFVDKYQLDESFSFAKILPVPADMEYEYQQPAYISYQAKYGDWQDIAQKLYPKMTFLIQRREQLIELMIGEQLFDENSADRIDHNVKHYGVLDGSMWCSLRWGTQHEAEDVSIKNKGDRLEISFITAYIPPKNFVKNVAKLHPELIFRLRFFESGLQYGGVIQASGDNVYKRKFKPWYDALPKEMKKQLKDNDDLILWDKARVWFIDYLDNLIDR